MVELRVKTLGSTGAAVISLRQLSQTHIYCLHSLSLRDHLIQSPMPSKSPAQTLLEKADKKASSSIGWFASSSTKFEEAGDLYQQAANSFKLEKLFREAGDAFSKEAECREKCKETNDAANAWWNAAKAYKRGFPDRALIVYHRYYIAQRSPPFSRHPSVITNSRAFNPSWPLPPGR
jgi:hypothetical protein